MGIGMAVGGRRDLGAPELLGGWVVGSGSGSWSWV